MKYCFKFAACVYKMHLSLFENPLCVYQRLLFQSTNVTNAYNIEFTIILFIFMYVQLRFIC